MKKGLAKYDKHKVLKKNPKMKTKIYSYIFNTLRTSTNNGSKSGHIGKGSSQPKRRQKVKPSHLINKSSDLDNFKKLLKKQIQSLEKEKNHRRQKLRMKSLDF